MQPKSVAAPLALYYPLSVSSFTVLLFIKSILQTFAGVQKLQINQKINFLQKFRPLQTSGVKPPNLMSHLSKEVYRKGGICSKRLNKITL